MDPKTLKAALNNEPLFEEMAREARALGSGARADRQSLLDRMNDQMLIGVARAAGVIILPAKKTNACEEYEG
jgi:hypothetical protein